MLRLLLSLALASAPPTLDLPEPTPLDRGDGAERAPSPEELPWELPQRVWYTAPRTDTEVGLRTGVGLGLRASRGGAPTFVLDLVLSTRVVLSRGSTWWGLWPELGYALTAGEHTGHEVSLGLGVSRGFNEELRLAYVPRVVVGADRGRPALGLRHGVVVMLGDNTWGAQLDHTWLATSAGTDAHDLRLTVFLDLGLLLARYVPGGSRNSR